MELPHAVAKEARRRALQQALNSAWLEDDFARLWEVLLAHAVSGVDDTPQVLDYGGFLRVKEDCGRLFGAERTASLLRASAFCMLPKSGGTVDVAALFEALMCAAAWQQTALHLHYHDGTGDGCLRERELHAYLTELAPTLPGLQALPESFVARWARMACRAFYFFERRRDNVSIQALLASESFSQLLELQGAPLRHFRLLVAS